MGQKFVYIYDFGDDWIHKITLENIEKIDAANADCITGKGACPPEDCGGPWGYANFRKILNNPDHEEYEDTREWVLLAEGEQWDAQAFDITKAKQAVSTV